MKTFFSSPYNRGIFQNFLQQEFLPNDYQIEEEEIDSLPGADRIQSIKKLGKVPSMNNLSVYEIHHHSEHDPRVSLTRETFSVMKHLMVKHALAVFVSDKSDNYRFSFINSGFKVTDKGRAKRKFSDPRRLSFYLGPDAKTKTPEKYLRQQGRVTDLNDLRNRFNIHVLTKQFYKELSNWYFWALKHVQFPEDVEKQDNGRKIAVIRLITRLVFIWFMQEKELVPKHLFDKEEVQKVLNSLDREESTYYKAILQNLFFATLNTPKEKRGFVEHNESASKRAYHYKDYFNHPEQVLELFKGIPFLNGGLFECLDYSENGDETIKEQRLDGFPSYKSQKLRVPNFLFFGDTEQVDLNDEYGTKDKTYKVRGLVNILNDYNFTIDENTPIDREVSLDPELLGQIFENLLASYNPETATTARKATGSYYTPRHIIEYMVDEALKKYFLQKLPDREVNKVEWEEKLDHLLSYHIECPEFSDEQIDKLIESIEELKIIDPAVGSGAFPMGILQKLVLVLNKIDPDNTRWKNRQIQAVEDAIEENVKNYNLEQKQKLKQQVISQIEKNFEANQLDYGRKLYLIQKCIYGVDIQPIAVQIAKLRFFISLLVDEQLVSGGENEGIDPLPNLETKFIAANTLVDLDKDGQQSLKNEAVIKLEEKLQKLRKDYFNASLSSKKEEIRKEDRKTRKRLISTLREIGFSSSYLESIGNWNPYDSNKSANFFDPEWMFNIRNGFDIAIGNPPYGKDVLSKKEKKSLNHYKANGCDDICGYFIEREINLLKERGVFSNIVAGSVVVNKRMHSVRTIMRNNGDFYLSFFGIRPAKLFPANDKRVSITIGAKGSPEPLKTTKNIRFTEEQRDSLFKDLKFSSTENLLLGNKMGEQSNSIETRLPKIGSSTNRQILVHLREFHSNNMAISDYLTNQGNYSLQYRKSGRYWLTAMDSFPYESTMIADLSFNNSLTKDLTKLIINSSLFYFYWCVYGNNRHLQKHMIKAFPFPLIEKLNNEELIRDYSTELDEQLTQSFYPDRGQVGEFDIGSIKEFIDDIDTLLGDIYGFTDAQVDHLINYDSHLRGG